MTPALTYLYNLEIWRQTINKKTSKIFQLVIRVMKAINQRCDEKHQAKDYFIGSMIREVSPKRLYLNRASHAKSRGRKCVAGARMASAKTLGWERHWQFQEQREEGCDWYIESEEESGK